MSDNESLPLTGLEDKMYKNNPQHGRAFYSDLSQSIRGLRAEYFEGMCRRSDFKQCKRYAAKVSYLRALEILDEEVEGGTYADIILLLKEAAELGHIPARMTLLRLAPQVTIEDPFRKRL